MKRHAATVMGVLSIPARPLECIVLRIVHRVPVIQTVKQTVQPFREKVHRDVTVMQQATCVTDSSMYIEHIINPVRHRVRLIRRWKIV
jgi:hypothetical protein